MICIKTIADMRKLLREKPIAMRKKHYPIRQTIIVVSLLKCEGFLFLVHGSYNCLPLQYLLR